MRRRGVSLDRERAPRGRLKANELEAHAIDKAGRAG
jgi:hypothetical protein